uniref:Ubiquinone biosynthesis protein n=1 Tax=Culicoides sonorensis TaxID=179676 RepID=A0A336LME5_CULSO
MNGSLDVIKIVQENLDNDDLISATEIITKLDENSLQILCADLIALVASYLTVENYKENVDKYLCCENILKLIAKSATKEDALFELLEVLENVSHDEQFISVLKALQVVLIRLNHANTQAIAWVLDSIIQYINHEIDVPEILKGNIGPEEEKIIENDSVVQRLLSLYFTIFLFLDPVQQCLLDQTRNESTKIFFVHDFNSRNVISTFLLKLMEGSFAYLNYSKEPLLYARQCADNLIKLFCRNFSNPYMLLEIIEDRKAFKQLSYKTQHAESNSIFYSEDRFNLRIGLVRQSIYKCTNVRFLSVQPPSDSASKSDVKESFDAFRVREEKKEEDFMNSSSTNSEENRGNEKPKENETEPLAIKVKILEAALSHVPKHGWSKKALSSGAEDVGLPSISHGMFPRGGVEIIEYFNAQCNTELIEYLKKASAENSNNSPTEFIAKAVQFRLRMIVPYKDLWPQALALMSVPSNVPVSLSNLLTMVDDICYYAGDRSVDFNWYTRRIGLASIFKATEFFMLQDKSNDHEKTWSFLEHRIADASKMQDFLKHSEDLTKGIQQTGKTIFDTARSILGLNFNRR